jgi:hypothetical protein
MGIDSDAHIDSLQILQGFVASASRRQFSVAASRGNLPADRRRYKPGAI